MAKESPAQQKKVGQVMHAFKQGELRSSSGKKVRSPQQAVAIGLSEAGASRTRSPAANRRAKSRTEKGK